MEILEILELIGILSVVLVGGSFGFVALSLGIRKSGERVKSRLCQ